MTKSLVLSRAVNGLSCGLLKYGWWSANYRSEESPIVLGGCSRSGTTLLRSLLDAHSRLFIAPETELFSGNANMQQLARETGMPMRRMRRHYLRSCCLAEFAERVLKELMAIKQKRQWGEKTPNNVRQLRAICHFFPNARFIHIIRDGRDVVASLRTHPKYRWRNGERVPTGIIRPWNECIQEWANDVRRGLHWRQDPRYIEVRYEDLVAAPEALLRPLLSRLGEGWEPAIMEKYKTDESASHPGLTQPIGGSAVARWCNDLPLEARELFRAGAASLLVELGYAVNDSWIDQQLSRAERSADGLGENRPGRDTITAR